MTSSEREFLAACDENGISKLTTAAQKEKAKLIAKQKGVGSWDSVDYLASLLETHAREEQEKKDAEHRAELQKLKAKELKKKAELEKYAGLHGREKPKRYYTDLIAEKDIILQKQEDAKKSSEYVQNLFDSMARTTAAAPADKDWAIAGGIAAGLAGPAAGVAVASGIQRQNAENHANAERRKERASELRANGTRIAKTLLETSGVDASTLRSARSAKVAYTKLRDESEIKLLDESVDSSKLLSLLNPTVLSLKANESEATVTVTLGIEGHIIPIFESTPAVVDGWFSCMVLNHSGEYCGSASFVLPVTGAESAMELTGIAELYGDSDSSYTLVFDYADLWLIETSDDKKLESIDLGALPLAVDENGAPFQKALKLFLDSGADIAQLKKARTLFDSLGNWAGSDRFAEKCADRITAAEQEEQRRAEQARLDAEEKAAAKRLADEKAEKAWLAEKKKNRIIISIAAIIAVAFVVAVVVIKVIIPNNQYNSAVALLESGDYIEAYETLDNLNGYKDSAELQNSIASDYKEALLNNADIGGTVYFGTYEQDNDMSTGKEDIEWIILDKDGDNILIISKYALDCRQYNTSYTHITWKSCSLREWMNSDFLDDAFSSAEIDKILTSNNTRDQIFLLSYAEVEKYFPSDDARKCVPSAYAIAQGVNTYTNDSNHFKDGAATCSWLLRTPSESFNAEFIKQDGTFDDYFDVNEDTLGVRPAMWISLE